MLIFEFLDGGTLADRLQAGRMQVPDVIDLGIALSDALHRLHSSSLLHRDVKPSNVGFTRAGVPKLLDFGLARIIDDSRIEGHLTQVISQRPMPSDGVTVPVPITRSLQLVGTPAYMSPEAINNKPFTPRFDLWSLSVVLVECLAGRNPFAAPTVQETLKRVSQASISSVSELLSECPDPLVEFLSDALAHSERRRPLTAIAFKQRLESMKHDVPVSVTL